MEDSGHFPERWAAVQESIARVAGISLLTYDRHGALRAAAGHPELCRIMESSPEGARRCAADCHSRRRAVRDGGATVFFRCHAGLHCFAAALPGDGEGRATLLGGLALERAGDIDLVAEIARSLELPAAALRRAVGDLPFASPRLIADAAELTTRAAETIFAGEQALAAERSRVAVLSSLLALGADLARERDPHEVCSALLDAASIVAELRGACVLVRDEAAARFRLRASCGAPPAQLPLAGLAASSPLLRPALGAEAQALVTERSHIAGEGFPPGTASVTLFPVRAGDRVLAVLCVLDTSLGAAQCEALAALCRQAALSLSNALLREQLERRTRELERSVGIRDRLAPLLEWEEVLDAVLEEAVRQARAREASLMLLDRGDRSLRIARARGPRSVALREVSVPAGEGIAGRVAAEGRPLLVEEIERDERLRRPRRPRYRTGSFLVVPLLVRRRVVGVINLADKETDAAFSTEDLEAVLTVTANASWALQRSALHGRVQRLREQAVTDPLTKLANRRYLEARLREEMGRTNRHGAPFALTMIDVDAFKEFNDRQGHPAGDALLAAIAGVVRGAARDIDLVARYGGDEFAIVSPQTSAPAALSFAERIREAVATHRFGLAGLPEAGGITLSAGVAGYPADAGDLEGLVRAADAALYQAKAGGRNRVQRAGP
ncbi:MAG TPA: diguanylate cyclase [bacterium]